MDFDKLDNFTKLAHNKDSVFKDSFTIFLDKSLEFLDADLAGQISEILSPETTAVETIGDFAVKVTNKKRIFGVHNEFETDVSKDDFIRFGVYNLVLSRKHKIPFTTIIITENRPAKMEYVNGSITFKPKIICLNERDGDATLQKIKQQLANGEPINELELVYLPMYGSNQGTTMYEFLESAIQLTPQISDNAQITKKLQLLLLFLTLRTADTSKIKKILEDNMTITNDHPVVQALLEIGNDRGRAEGRAEGKAEGIVEGKAEGIVEGKAKGKVEGRTEVLSMMKDLIKKGLTFEEATDYLANNT